MKVRKDFVTNSSSSSFILGFTSSDNVERELKDGFPEWAAKYFDTVNNDVCQAEQFDRDEVIKRVRDEMQYSVRWKVEDYYRRRTGCSYSEAIDYINTDKGQKEVESYLEEIVNNTIREMDGKSIFVEVSYSDNDGYYFSELEHEIMPRVDSTIIRFSHH